MIFIIFFSTFFFLFSTSNSFTGKRWWEKWAGFSCGHRKWNGKFSQNKTRPRHTVSLSLSLFLCLFLTHKKFMKTRTHTHSHYFCKHTKIKDAFIFVVIRRMSQFLFISLCCLFTYYTLIFKSISTSCKRKIIHKNHFIQLWKMRTFWEEI